MVEKEMRIKREDRARWISKVRFRMHDIKEIRKKYPDWDSLSKKEKMEALKNVDPIYEEDRTNTFTEDGIRHIVDKLQGQSVADVSHYAIGSGTTPPEITDPDLETRENTQVITSTTDAGLTLETSTFWDTTEANGITFAEGGILAGGTPGTPGSGGVLMARTLFTPQTKDSTKTFTVDHDITGIPL